MPGQVPKWYDMDEEQLRSYLRHPVHRPRCACGRYGLHLFLRILDDGASHELLRCQPWREVLEEDPEPGDG